MQKIKLNNKNLKIQVNDDGEYIVLPFEDKTFIHRFYKMIDDFKEVESSFIDKGKLIDELEDSIDEFGISSKERKFMELDLEIHTFLKEQIDLLFGENTCKKVFGDIVPSFVLITEFLDEISPFIEIHLKEKIKVINKYSAEREGNV